MASSAKWKRNYPKVHARQSLESWYRTTYGLDPHDLALLMERQDRSCAICGSAEDRLCVDHDHVTGEVRGLLCFRCNSAIGKLCDDPELLRVAINYLLGGEAPSHE